MSLRYEQVRAIEQARDLLRDILNRPQRAITRSEIRQRAALALRHYPLIDDEGVIHWSADEFTRPKDGRV